MPGANAPEPQLIKITFDPYLSSIRSALNKQQLEVDTDAIAERRRIRTKVQRGPTPGWYVEGHLWLPGVVRNCAPLDGAKLKLVREDDLPKPIKALVWIPLPQTESDQILHRLKVQNQKLPVNSWRVVSTKADPKGQQMVVAMDDSSWKVPQDTYHGRLHLQFLSVSFRLLGRKTKE
ncbi:hypothetical protein Trydic_g3422 [Trypoxylus dichotomus]